MHNSTPEQDTQLLDLDIHRCYLNSPYRSIKHSSYFLAYTDLLEKYRNKPITFVEIGILNGGSLFMWRDFFGPNARIIGIDLNPEASKWSSEGFEIYIGSQSDPSFWGDFFAKVGDVDIVLDDGGHTNEQQIITSHGCIPHIRDGGLLIVEDTHCSYLKEFGNPSPYSFIEWVKKLIDNINSRYPKINASRLPYKNAIYSLTVFESIVCFSIDRRKCQKSHQTANNGILLDAEDYRHKMIEDSINRFTVTLGNRFKFLQRYKIFRGDCKSTAKRLYRLRKLTVKNELLKYFNDPK